MPNLTIRNIPNNIMNKIKILSEIEKRSMNSEILKILEKGINEENKRKFKKILSMETRIRLWKNLSGKWEDERKTDDIIKEIYADRSEGRDYSL